MYGVESYNTENCKYGREIANKVLAGLGYTDHVWVTGVVTSWSLDIIHHFTVVLAMDFIPTSQNAIGNTGLHEFSIVAWPTSIYMTSRCQKGTMKRLPGTKVQRKCAMQRYVNDYCHCPLLLTKYQSIPSSTSLRP